jgi:hypothetical protein
MSHAATFGKSSSAHVPISGVRVDPHDRQVITVTPGQFGKWRDAHRALPAERGDPRRVVVTDDLQSARELDQSLLEVSQRAGPGEDDGGVGRTG